MRNMGIILILVGIGLLFISIFFSSGINPNLDLISNISKAKIVMMEEKEGIIEGFFREQRGEPAKARVAIPLKYALSLSVILILTGTGMVLLSSKRK